MSNVSDIQKSLVDVDDCVLLVIDIQDYFLKKYDQAKSQALVGKVVWLLHVAQHLNVPVVAMAEDIDRTGSLHQAIQDALPPGTEVHDKDFFGLAGNSDILADVASSGRKRRFASAWKRTCVWHSRQSGWLPRLQCGGLARCSCKHGRGRGRWSWPHARCRCCHQFG